MIDWISFFTGVYLCIVLVILFYEVKNSNSHTSYLALVTIAFLFPITYPIKVLFYLKGDDY